MGESKGIGSGEEHGGYGGDEDKRVDVAGDRGFDIGPAAADDSGAQRLHDRPHHSDTAVAGAAGAWMHLMILSYP